MFIETANPIVEIIGTPTIQQYGVLAPRSGRTTLTLKSNRVVEQTRYRLLGINMGSRYCEVPTSQLDSLEILERGNPIWTVLAFATLVPTYGIGTLIFLLLFFLRRRRYLVVHSQNNTLAVLLQESSDLERARVFVEELLRVTDRSIVQL